MPTRLIHASRCSDTELATVHVLDSLYNAALLLGSGQVMSSLVNSVSMTCSAMTFIRGYGYSCSPDMPEIGATKAKHARVVHVKRNQASFAGAGGLLDPKPRTP